MGIPLPVPVIQHIQSFFPGKQAAQTSVLSKAWYKAWLTRPDLYFDQKCFNNGRRCNLFTDFVEKTLQRYEEFNLNINSFKLRVSDYYKYEEISELVKRVLKLCVNGADFEVEFPFDNKISLELLHSKTFVRFSLSGGMVGQPIRRGVAFSSLKSLTLKYVSLVCGLFRDTFPFLEDLSLLQCRYSYRGQEISSTSLRCITIVNYEDLKAKVSVPNIRKFVFSGFNAPLLSLMEASTEWESDISLKYLHQDLISSWFVNLNGFLTRLSSSMCKVSLNIWFFDYCGVGLTQSFSTKITPKLENLMLDFRSLPISKYDVVIGTLFGICHPKYVTQNWFPDACVEETANNKLLKFLGKRLIRDSENSGRKSTYLYLLEAANVDFFDSTQVKWQPLDWQTLMNGSKGLECKQKVRFELKWQDCDMTNDE